MDTTQIQLSPELRIALDAQSGMPIHIHDRETQKVYLLIEQGALPELEEDELLRLLQPALEDETRGDVALLDMDAVKREAEKMLVRRQARREQ